MSSTASPVSATPKPRRWLRRLGLGIGGLLALLVVLYFVVTSGAFFKGVILPKVGAALNAQVTVSDASISPFSQVTLRDLKVLTTGAEPLVTAQEVRARYSLWDIIGGNLKISEVTLESPTVTLITHADGTSNLDPITQAPKAIPADEKKQPAPDPAAKPLQIDLGKFAHNNATVRVITEHQGGGRDLAEVSAVNVTLNDLKNGQNGKLNLAANISLDNKPPAPSSAGSLKAKLDGAFDIGLGNDLSLSAFKGGLRLNVPEAGGALAQLAGFALTFDTDLSADPKSVVLRALTLTGAQKDKTFLVANLSSPMKLALDGNADAVGDAALTLTLTNVNLADWKAFAPEFDAAGLANASVKLLSQQGGKQIDFSLAARLDGLSAIVGSNRFDNVTVEATASGRAAEFKRYNVAGYRLTVTREGEPVTAISGSAMADTEKQTTEVDLNVAAFLDRLLRIAPQPGVNLTSGRVEVVTKFSQAGTAQTVAGKLRLIDLTGAYGDQRFTNLAVNTTYDVALKSPEVIDLRQLELVLAPTARARTNAVQLSGQMDLSKSNALEGTLKLTADTLDVTPYYDLFAGQPAPEKSPETPSQPKPGEPAPPTGGDTEPDPVQLPIKRLTFDTTIGHCYLREVDLSNVVTSVRVEGSHVTLKPVQLALNGAPASAEIDLDLSQPGWRYSIAFNATQLPIEPIANSFSPDYRGRAKGELFANGKIEGAGITGPNLRKNLTANLGLSFTNAEIEIVGSRLKGFLAPVAAAIKAPGLLNSPLNWVGVDTTVGGGKLSFGQLALVSPAFAGATKGEIALADNLGASTISKWPMTLQLSKALADRVNLTPRGTPTNAALVALPQFLKVAGTVNDPKPDIDLKALAGAALLQYTDKIPGLDEKTGQLLKGLGGMLSGQGGANTNAPTTNKSPASGLLDLLNRKK
jgi:uncharacterized protein involved in outer membrane biogenesis